jgi:quercetin dioxygenase-like cupin family protein
VSRPAPPSRISGDALSPLTLGSVRPEEVRFEPFAPFPPGARLAVVVGDPGRAGPYVIRVEVSAGVRLLPHTHPEDRIYTVISGVFYIGLGEAFDESGLVAYGPGSVIVLPARTAHYHWARSGRYVTQVSGYGPLGIEYVDVTSDLRGH